MTPRTACVLSLNACFKSGKFVNLELDSAIKKYGFEGVDKSFFTILLYGTTERIITIDYILSLFSKNELSKTEPLTLSNLRLAVYQIFYMDRVPDSAACNEAVEICKSLTPHSYVGFINALLRNIIRRKEEITERINSLTGLSGLSIKYSIPQGIVEIFAKDYGEKETEKLCKHLCENPPYLSIRTNTLLTTRERLLSSLGNVASADSLTNSGIRINGTIPVSDLCGFEKGLFFVQDTASIKTSELLSKEELCENPLILDVCACPGGKSFSTAINFENKAKIISMDLHKNRLSLIERGAARLSINCITTLDNNAKTPREEYLAAADAVLCDVPCSGLGVIAKKADIKYKELSDIERLPELQYEILKESAKYLKDGGILIYSTCTLKKAENEDIINRFLSENGNFSLVPFELSGEMTKGYATLLPHIHNTDGFFMAKLKKRKDAD